MLCKTYLRTEDVEGKDGTKMSERFKALSSKYMCDWMPVEALSICTYKIDGNEKSSTIDCLLCLSKSFIQTVGCLWTAMRLPPRTVQGVEFLENLRTEFEIQKTAFYVMSEKFKPGFLKQEEEAWADNIEILITKLKEAKLVE